MRNLILLTGGVLLLAACEPAPTGSLDPAMPSLSDACGAAAHQGLIGQPADAWKAAGIKDTVRVIPAGSAITADYSPQRMNIELDEKNRISAVACY